MLRIVSFCSLAFLASLNIYADDSSGDVENDKRRKAAHKYLLDEFAKEHESIFSADKKLLHEVSLYKGEAQLAQSKRFDLPKKTHLVASMFDQIVVRGENLESIKAAFSFQSRGKYLRKEAGTGDKLAVFSLMKIPANNAWRKSVQPNQKSVPSDSDQILSLNIFSHGKRDVVVKNISLRRTQGLLVDFKSYQEGLYQFGDYSLARNFFVETRERGVQELSKSLNENSESFMRIVDLAASGPSLSDFKIKGILADRRVAKLYEHLSRMDADAAAIQASEWFDNSFEAYKNSWENAKIVPSAEIYSPHAHMFLCAEFCSPEYTISKLDDWNSWHAGNSERGFTFKALSNVDILFSMNLHLNMIRGANRWSINELNGFLLEELGPSFIEGGDVPPRLEFGQLRTSDFTPKQDDVLTFVPVFSYISALQDKGRHEFVFQTLRDELLKPKE